MPHTTPSIPTAHVTAWQALCVFFSAAASYLIALTLPLFVVAAALDYPAFAGLSVLTLCALGGYALIVMFGAYHEYRPYIVAAVVPALLIDAWLFSLPFPRGW
jgi:hypothetical protein